MNGTEIRMQWFGVVIRISAKDVAAYPELVERRNEMARAELDHRIRAAGLVPGDTMIAVIEKFVKRIKEHHHAHGWQMVEVECPALEAETILVMFEQAGFTPDSQELPTPAPTN